MDPSRSPLAYPSSPATPGLRRRGSQMKDSTDPLFSQSTHNGGGGGRLGSSQRRDSSAPQTPRFPRSDVNASFRHRMFSEGRLHSQQSRNNNNNGSDVPGSGGAGAARLSSTAFTSDPASQDVRAVIWGTTVNIHESIRTFKDFLQRFTIAYKIDALRRFAAENQNEDDAMVDVEFASRTVKESDKEPFYINLLTQMKKEGRRSMNLDCSNLKIFASSRKLYVQLIRYPQETIPILDFALSQLYMTLFEDEPETELKVKPFNLERSVNMRDLDPEDINQLVTVKGLMIRTSPVIPDLKLAFFRCSVCEQVKTVEVEEGRVAEPTRCPREVCKSKNTMMLVHNRCYYADKQVCRMQETPDETPDGQTPYTVSLCCYEDLVDVAKPGDRLEVTGIFRAVPVRVAPNRRTVKALFRTYVDVVHIKKTDKRRIAIDDLRNENEFETNYEENDMTTVDEEDTRRIKELSEQPNLYDLLSRSVAPSIFGMEDVKKGVLLQLFGGANRFRGEAPGMPRIRGDLNILLVGDPGVSKSQLLQYVHKLTPRGVYTSGKGSSAVGLTAYVTRDPDTRQLVLESGALVLSDGGVCCIDEFDKMSDHTRSVLHEVMEQQTISVAKAGIITTLNARTSILASANPINSKFDPTMSVVANINLPPPLVSRFDLLFLLLDTPNEAADRLLASHIVGLYLDERSAAEREATSNFVPIELFAKYISTARKIQPEISEAAGDMLVRFYTDMRQTGRGGYGRENVVTATTRQLESMIRLAEAHARMRMSEVVEREDVEEAHRLIVTALLASATDPSTGRIDMDILQTGVSARERGQRHAQRTELMSMFESMRGSSVKFIEALRMFREQVGDQRKISEGEFLRLIKDLETVVVTGSRPSDIVIRKSFPR